MVTGEAPSLAALGILVTVIAAGYHPVLVRVRDTTDELLFGGRADPVETLTRLGTELSAGSSPQEWLRALRLALGVPAVELRAPDRTVARSGDDPGAGSEVTPLRVGSEQVGELVVSLPPEQLRLPAATRAVLDLVAGPLAQAVHATRLAAQLRTSRGRVVAALEEERRRVRRDLHDGLGPTLTGIAYSADAARNLVTTDPTASTELLRALRADVADAIAEIRRIVYGLRPRAIDELGLVGAVRQQVSRLGTSDGRPLRVDLVAPDALPDLPAAVEVVAYRVAVEAVTNVARHAGVDEATLRFAVGTAGLEVEVSDAGGSAAAWVPGVGLAGMRERVEEVGGVLTVETMPGRSRVAARIPLPDDALPDEGLPDDGLPDDVPPGPAIPPAE
jgi:signal transduction histidine kinase